MKKLINPTLRSLLAIKHGEGVIVNILSPFSVTECFAIVNAEEKHGTKNCIFFCQDGRAGTMSENKMGMNFSWIICNEATRRQVKSVTIPKSEKERLELLQEMFLDELKRNL